jgi:uncharacterized membrane protein
MDQAHVPASARLRKATIQVIALALCGAVAYSLDGERGLGFMLALAAVNLGLNARARKLRG